MSAWLTFLSVVLTMCDCQIQTQQQQQILPQTVQPSQVATTPQIVGPASTLSQLIVNLLNYKLRWLSQVAGRLGANSTVTGPGYPLQTTTGGYTNIPQVPISVTPTNPFVPVAPATPPIWPGAGNAPQTTLPGNTPGSFQGGQTVAPIIQPGPVQTTTFPVSPGVGVTPTLPVIPPAQGNQPVTTPEQAAPLPTAPVLQAIGFPPPSPQPAGPDPVSVPVPFQGVQADKPFSQSSPSPVSVPGPFKTGSPQPAPPSAPLTSSNPPPQANLDSY